MDCPLLSFVFGIVISCCMHNSRPAWKKMEFRSVVCAGLLLMLPSCGVAINFLLIPEPINSHVLMFGRFGTALVSEGHTASMIVPNNIKIPDFIKQSEIRVFQFEGEGQVHAYNRKEISEMMLKAKFAKTKVEMIDAFFNIDNLLLPVIKQECLNLLEDGVLRKTLLAENFDYAVVDGAGTSCTLNYPISLELKYIMFSIPTTLAWYYRIPDLPSFVPEQFTSTFSDEMTFFERLENTFNYVMVLWYWNTTNPIDMTKYSKGKPLLDMKDAVEDVIFWFLLEDNSISYAKPHMPNSEAIGDIMVSEAQELPPDFKSFMDDSPEGVILVSFGSFFDLVPDAILQKFCEVFSRVTYKVLWKLNVKPSCVNNIEDKVKLVPWTPQNDILAHPNLVLFITHCGLNSILESIYHGKPMLGFPISLDQPYNGAIIKHKGYGISMDLANFEVDEMVNNIEEIVRSPRILKNVKLASGIIKDKPQNASRRIAHWVEHIHQYGMSHLRTGAFKMNVFQFLMVDVILVIFGLLCFSAILASCLACCLYKGLRKCRKWSTSQHIKTD